MIERDTRILSSLGEGCGGLPARNLESLFNPAAAFPPVHLYTGAARDVWDAIVNDPGQRQYFAHLPFAEVARDVTAHVACAELVPVWIGAGSGFNERQYQSALTKHLAIPRSVIHEIDVQMARACAAVFASEFPEQEIFCWSGLLSSLTSRSLVEMAGEKNALIGMIGATLTNFPNMPHIVRELGELARPGDLILVDYLREDRSGDRRWPKNISAERDTADVLRPIESEWIRRGLESFSAATGLSQNAAPKMSYRVHEFSSGFATEILAQFNELPEPLSVISFIRLAPEKLASFLEGAGFELIKDYNPVSNFHVALGIKR